MWKVGTAAKSTVGGWGGAEPGLGGKDNMWVVNILMSGGARHGDEEDGKGQEMKKGRRYG